MPNYEKQSEVLALLKKDQQPEIDNRQMARDAHYFVEKIDGQWEPDIITKFRGRPRYTFDLVNPIVDQITGEMDRADFDIRVRPAGGEASKETAKVIDGMIRNIENMSDAKNVYMASARDMVISGIGGWLVTQKWADSTSFDQDLLIEPICDYPNRVWFDSGAIKQTMEDANHVFILTDMLKSDYEEKFPKGSGVGISKDFKFNAYYFKPENITVGQIYYKDPQEITLVKMTDGSVYVKDEKFQSVEKELRAQGITVKEESTRESYKVVSRMFDGRDWLTPKEETVFDLLPVIQTMGNFRISDSKVIYRGVVEKLMDPQRVYNYTKSREVEEVALSPRAKWWMTKDQAKSKEVQKQLSTLNTNFDPVQFYDHDDRVPGPPQQSGGAQLNQGLLATSQSMAEQIQASAGLFGINQGDVQSESMSGIAIQSLQNKGDNATIKYFTSQEIAIQHTAKVLIGAIPKVYDAQRTVRVLGEDGSEEMVQLNDVVFDMETQQVVTLNDLTVGKYDVVCDVGPAFQNRQQETVKALQELSATVPGVGELTADIQVKNIPSPGMDLAAERLRVQLLKNGAIPFDQMTDEEKEQMMIAQQQPQEPTPQDKIANAELARVEAETADTISKANERDAKTQLQAQQQEMNQIQMILDQQQQFYDILQTQADTLKTIREAMGVDTVVGPSTMAAYIEQSEQLDSNLQSNQDRL